MVLLLQKLIFSLFIFLFQQLNKLKGIEIFSSTQNFIDKSPPNLYKWIEENAHICTLVPINGKNFISFLSEEEGNKCFKCPKLNINEIPTMACAIEIISNNNNIEHLECHKLPELCVLELKNRYEEFYLNNNTIDKKTNLDLLKPPGPPGENKENNNAQLNEGEEEEKIFKATELIFSTQPQNIFDKNKEEKEEENEEEEEQKHLEFDGTKINEEEFLKVFERLNNKKNLEILTTNKQTTTTINPENLNISTTIRANIFGQINDQEGIPVNLKMTTISTGRRIHSHGEKEKIFPPSQQNNFDKNEIIGKIQKRIKNIKKEEEDEDFSEENNKNNFCKDTHELCCFWAVAGECNNNPFWMRVKCPMTCGTCGCKVKRADKCKSTGVKCILTTTTTISTSTEQTKTTLTTTTTKGPTPPPLTTTPTTTISTTKKRKTRPTPPPKMPGHRPQRPKQWKSSTPKETSKHPKIVSLKKEYPFNPSFVSKNNFVNGDGVSDNNLNNDYSDETEEPQLIEEENIYSTTIKFKQIYEEYLKKNNKLNKENKKIINKNWLNNLKTTPIEPLTLPTDKTITTTTTIITTTTTTKRQTCFNYHKLCEFWADMGECESNPFWMRPHCQKSCSSCGESLGDISTPKPKSGCSNIHILCPFWAFIGECGRNPRWMGMHCRASCQLC